jgi:hypothetical protein
VERAGAFEGIEAWRLPLARYVAQTCQSKAIKMIHVLNLDCKQGDPFDQLEAIGRACARCTESTRKDIDDDTKIGIVITGMDPGPLSARCEKHDDFRDEADTSAKARASNLLIQHPWTSDCLAARAKATARANYFAKCCWASSVKGGGKSNGSVPPKCGKCGKTNHTTVECWSDVGQGGGAKKECYKCGMKNHLAKDCRASDAKIRKYKEAKNKHSVHGLSADSTNSSTELSGLGFLCNLTSPSLEVLRKDRASRSTTFRIDPRACTTVVPKIHQAARGYTSGGTARPAARTTPQVQPTSKMKDSAFVSRIL